MTGMLDSLKRLENFACRSCGGGAGELVLDLGEQPLANNLPCADDLGQPEPRFPLRLAVCTECWLLQITDLVPPVDLFSEYIYFSSYSDAWVNHAAESARRYLHEFSLGAEDWVMEIASNDGYLLRHFAAADVPHLGIEPAENVAAVAREMGVETRVDFFTADLARELAAERRADLVLGCNVFAHVPDPNDFVAGVKELLLPEGRAILEFPHAMEMIVQGEFDTIYHEHVCYFTLTALEPLFARHGLRITRVEELPLHGGSLRIFVRHEGCEEDATVATLRDREAGVRVASADFYRGFAARAGRTREVLCEQVAALRTEGRSVAAYGAAAKGTVLLNYCGLNTEQIDFVVDRSPHKQGRLMPGVHVPVIAPDELATRRPDVALLLAWNFADEILAQQSAYRDAGGKFLIPIPKVRLI
ncbi:MAG: class I SAM-dependent methyltransferase [Verrucomicrobiota bacterium]|nr:class I SAM-dependent methyltransferase [Verrucomicrobiota bacterium]